MKKRDICLYFFLACALAYFVWEIFRGNPVLIKPALSALGAIVILAVLIIAIDYAINRWAEKHSK